MRPNLVRQQSSTTDEQGHAKIGAMKVALSDSRPRMDGKQIQALHARLETSRLIECASESWDRGTPTEWLRLLLNDWAAYSIEGLQETLDRLHHFRADIDGVAVHLVHAPSTVPGAVPLLLTHGWPSSFLEYLHLLPLLTNPPSGEGDSGLAFHVVAPSLPGFGFSSPPPPRGFNHSDVAALWHRLMVEGLGYRRFVAHGSDLGAGVTIRLPLSYPKSVAAIHLATPGLAAPPEPWSQPIRTHFREVEIWTAEEGSYAHQHATKPATVGAGLEDSPVALAAWIGEKLHAWSSPPTGSPDTQRDWMLATLSLYWVTKTATTSLLPYWAHRHRPASARTVDEPPAVPTGIDIFGGENVPFPKPPRELAERYFRLTHWAEHDIGGHFPAVAAPNLLADHLRTVVSRLS